MRRHVIGIVLGLLALVAFGFLESLWFVLALISFIALWIYLVRIFPERKKVINLVMVGVLVVSVGADIYSNVVVPYSEMSRSAGKRRILFWDLLFARKIKPEMLESERAIDAQKQWLEDQYGKDSTRTSILNLQNDYKEKKISLDTVAARTKREEEKVNRFRGKLYGVPVSATAMTSAPSTSTTPTTVTVAPKYADFKMYDIPTGSWSGTIKATLFAHYDVRVTGRAVIKFSDGYTDTLNANGGHGFGQRAGVFQLLALEKEVQASIGQYNN